MNLKMFARIWLFAILTAVPVSAQVSDAPKLPDTPAGKRLAAFLNAFNSGDETVLRDFHADNDAKPVHERMPIDKLVSMDTQMLNEHGRFEVKQILESSDSSVAALLHTKNGNWLNLRLQVEQSPPNKIISIGLEQGQPLASSDARPTPAAVSNEPPDMTIDAAMRSQVIEAVAKNLNDAYVFPDVAKQMEKAIRDRNQKKEYDQITSAKVFAQTLTSHLREISHDKHLRVNYSAEPIPENGGRREPSPEDIERFRQFLSLRNFGFEKLERLGGNIGYIDLRGFNPAEFGADTAVAAMNFLANTDALIFDLRQNGGGDPAMVALISSYLFSEPTHLNDLYWREGDSTHQWWTLAYVPGKRYIGKDVYVLTSNRTFSAAEEFTYNLKNLKRATIIGETTGGGAHPGGGRRINEHFSVWVPSGRAINPVSKTNWEGTGVKPDIEAPADQALKTAHLMAVKKSLEKQTDERLKGQLKNLIADLEKELTEMKNKKSSQ